MLLANRGGIMAELWPNHAADHDLLICLSPLPGAISSLPPGIAPGANSG
jgi:hypothetical protein